MLSLFFFFVLCSRMNSNIWGTYYFQHRHLEKYSYLNLFYLAKVSFNNIMRQHSENDTTFRVKFLSTWHLIQIAKLPCHVLEINNLIKLENQTVDLKLQYHLLVDCYHALCFYLENAVSFVLFLNFKDVVMHTIRWFFV